MSHLSWPPTPEQRPRLEIAPGPDHPDLGSVSLDLRRAELYRMLDAIARAHDDARGELISEFERAWEEFKVLTAQN